MGIYCNKTAAIVAKKNLAQHAPAEVTDYKKKAFVPSAHLYRELRLANGGSPHTHTHTHVQELRMFLTLCYSNSSSN